MKFIKLIIVLFVVVVAGVGNSWADRGHGYGGHGYGGHGYGGVAIGPYWEPGYYPIAPYFYPPYYPTYNSPAIVYSEPQVYVQQQAPLAAEPTSSPPPPPTQAAATVSSDYWYYCKAAKGYYPYVKECPSGWQKVPTTPPGQR